MHRRALFFLVLAIPSGLSGATAGDVRRVLETLKASTPISVTVKVSSGGNPPGAEPASASAGADCSGDVVRISSPASELAKASSPNAHEVRRIMNASSLAAKLDSAPALLDALRTGRIVKEQSGQWKGRPATQFVLQLETKIPEEARKFVREMTSTMTLWVDSDALPLASEIVTAAKVRFLLLRAESVEKTTTEYVRVADRLVAARVSAESSHSGVGSEPPTWSVLTITVRAGAAQNNLDPR